MNTQLISIYVFRRSPRGVEYLVTRKHPRVEFDWGAVETSLRPTENLEEASQRWMRVDWQAPCPQPWIDLHLCAHQHIGDLDLVSWSVGYGVEGDWTPPDLGSHRAGEVDEARWVVLGEAFQLFAGSAGRTALFRLHSQVA